jgi:phosphate acyltransferase
VRIDRTDEPSVFEREEAYSLVAPVGCRRTCTRTRRRCGSPARVATELELACSRCAEGFTVPVRAAFDLLYLPAASAETEAEHEVQEDDLNTSYYREGVIDLGELVREQLYLALPMKPLCQEVAAGCARSAGPTSTRVVRLCARVGRPATGAAQGAEQERDRCLIRNAVTPRRAGASAAPTTRCPCQPESLPAVPRGQGAAPRVRALRLLQGPPGPPGGRELARARQPACPSALTEPPAPAFPPRRIAVDVMGGDHAPAHVVDGAVAAARHMDAGLLLVGDPAAIEHALARHEDAGDLDIAIVDAPDVVGMGESPAAALRRKPRASVRVTAELVQAGGRWRCSAPAARARPWFRPTPRSGCCRASSARRSRRPFPPRRAPPSCSMPGPTPSAGLPTCVQFATMGSVYAEAALGIAQPRVGLLSIGEEESKGNDLIREAHRLLKASTMNFIGNVEGRDVYSGVADVIVCDGFTGNVALKISEGLVDVIEQLLGEELQSTFSTRVGYLLSQRAFRRFRKRVDYSEYGGAPLLGVNGACIIGHGRSSVKADSERRGHGPPLRRLARHQPSCARPRGRAGDHRAVIAFIFPGQGSQKVGMGRALADAVAACRAVFDEADAALGESLSRVCFEGPAEQLTMTEYTQPAILTVSVAAARLLAERGIQPDVVAGHSLGEYSAHVAAGTFAFGDAVRIVRRRGRLHAAGRARGRRRHGRDSRRRPSRRSSRPAPRPRPRAGSSARPT